MRKYMSAFALLVFVVSAVIVCLNSWELKHTTTNAEAAAMTKIWKRIGDATGYLTRFCTALATESAPIADDLAAGKLDSQALAERLKGVLARNEDLGGIRFVLASPTGPLTGFQEPMHLFNAGITASDTGSLIPFLHIPVRVSASGSESVGELTMEIEHWRIKGILLTYDLGDYGFPFFIRADGRFLWHPHRDFMGQKRDLDEAAGELRLPELGEFARAMARHEKRFTPVTVASGTRMWLFGMPVQGFDLAVCGFVNRDEMLPMSEEMRKQAYRILVFSFTLLLSMVTVWFLRREKLEEMLWTASGVYTAIFAAGIGAIWLLTTSTFPPFIEGGPPLIEPSRLVSKIEDYQRDSKKAGLGDPYFIPTGVFVKAIEFESATNVKVTGYAWQKYPKDGIPDVQEGIVFPEAVDAEVEKAYERIENDVRVIGWNFALTLREWFDYSTYPFDQQDVWLRMWHTDFDNNVVLVPDLIAYSQLDPLELPGTDEDLILPSWQIRKTFFNFVDYNYNANFGMNRFAGQSNFPELHFHMLIGRNFMEPFMSCILPLFVVTLQMFSVLIISTKQETIAERLGFNSGVILQVAAALFFVVIYAQIDLRRRLDAEQIIYMDYFYFTMYFIFITVSANSIVYAHTDQDSLIEYRDNIIPKVLFWPVILGTLFVVTVAYFYP